MFEEQVERRAEAVAVVFGEESVSYGELNRRAKQVARYLRGKGVKTESRVAICLERGLEMMVALLGVLKAGGAYVPLDPGYPQERLQYMLEDSQPRVLLTLGDSGRNLIADKAIVVRLDADWNEIARESAQTPDRTIRRENVSYVIYTSGSTGQPKGVEVCHGALANFLMAMCWRAGMSGEDVVLAGAAVSFDIAALAGCRPL